MYKVSKRNCTALMSTVAALTFGVAAQAATLEITVTSNQSAGGLYLTPLLSIFHDGSYDSFNFNEASSAGVTAIAEEGDVSVERAAIGGAHKTEVITSPGGFAGAPVIDPGESTTITVDLDTASERYFSFLSMVIPSNDSFIGNANPFAYELFDGMGNFTGIGPIEIFGNEIWDNGTEVNNGIGAAFNAAGGTGTAENGVITSGGSLDFLLGQTTAAGTQVSSIPLGNELLATISISEVAPVPLPAALPLLLASLGGLGALRRRRRS